MAKRNLKGGQGCGRHSPLRLRAPPARAGRGQGHPHASTSRAQRRRDTCQIGTACTTSGCCRPHSHLKAPAESGEAQLERRAGMRPDVCIASCDRSAKPWQARPPTFLQSRAQAHRDTRRRATARTIETYSWRAPFTMEGAMESGEAQSERRAGMWPPLASAGCAPPPAPRQWQETKMRLQGSCSAPHARSARRIQSRSAAGPLSLQSAGAKAANRNLKEGSYVAGTRSWGCG